MTRGVAKSNPARTTTLLSVLLVTSALACLFAFFWMREQRSAAEIAAANLAAARADIEAIRAMRLSPGRRVAESLDAPEVSRRIREAAQAAGLAEPPETDPGASARLGASDYMETVVHLKFEPLTLKQLVTFLHHVSRLDGSARAKVVELGPPEVAVGGAPAVDQGGEDVWSAGATIGYLTYSPRK